MSLGPGHVMRAIEAVAANDPRRAFTVDELCRKAYPSAERIEKKHRVSVLRAMRSFVRQREGWAVARCRHVDFAGPYLRVLLNTAKIEPVVANLRDRRMHLLDDWDSFYAIRDRIDPHWRECPEG